MVPAASEPDTQVWLKTWIGSAAEPVYAIAA
jgi:hypothetical protein